MTFCGKEVSMIVDWINWKWVKNVIGLLKLEVGGNYCLFLF